MVDKVPELELTNLTEFVNALFLPPDKWFEIRIRFRRNADGTVTAVIAPKILPVSEEELKVMRGSKGGQLS